jgi:hypothetical protein
LIELIVGDVEDQKKQYKALEVGKIGDKRAVEPLMRH